jgi:putative sterol carrier protein
VLSKFLTVQWLDDLSAALAAHEGFSKAISNADISLQFEVTDPPEGTEKTYAIAVRGGAAHVASGPAENPDVTIVNNYETAAAMAKGELNTQMAFMTGKIKVSGNMGKIMMNQAMLTEFAKATSAMSVEY